MMGVNLLSGKDPKKLKLMGGHKWVAQIGKLFCKLLQVTKRSLLIDRKAYFYFKFVYVH